MNAQRISVQLDALIETSSFLFSSNFAEIDCDPPKREHAVGNTGHECAAQRYRNPVDEADHPYEAVTPEDRKTDCRHSAQCSGPDAHKFKHTPDSFQKAVVVHREVSLVEACRANDPITMDLRHIAGGDYTATKTARFTRVGAQSNLLLIVLRRQPTKAAGGELVLPGAAR